MRIQRLVFTLIPLVNLHTTRAFSSQNVLSAMSATMTSNVDVTHLANGVQVQNAGLQLEGKRRQVIEDVLNVSDNTLQSLGR